MDIADLLLLTFLAATLALTFMCGVCFALRNQSSIPSKTEFWRIDGKDIKWHERGCNVLRRRTDRVRASLCFECELVLEPFFCELCYTKRQR
jgi:hypothetical protein